MGYCIGMDAHKRFSVVAVMDDQGKVVGKQRLEHQRGAVTEFFSQFAAGTPVAVETCGSWYWLADEIEAAGCLPLLTHAGRAKAQLGQTHKSDALDAAGLARLLRNGTLPTVWIPPGEVRDQRELPRLRMTLGSLRTRLKNRAHATLEKHGLRVDEVSDAFGRRGRRLLGQAAEQLPPETKACFEQNLALVDVVDAMARDCERRMRERIAQSAELRRLKTLPGVGDILGTVIGAELGEIGRFPSAEKYSAYCGLVPRLHQSGSKSWHGQMVKQANQYLRQAYLEAANVVAVVRRRRGWQEKDVVRLYERVRAKRGHGCAVGAVGHRLAAATWWMLTRGEDDRER